MNQIQNLDIHIGIITIILIRVRVLVLVLVLEGMQNPKSQMFDNSFKSTEFLNSTFDTRH